MRQNAWRLAKKPLILLFLFCFLLLLLEAAEVDFRSIQWSSGQAKLGLKLVRGMSRTERARENFALWIFLKDKGPSAIRPQSRDLDPARRGLTGRCLWRRSKMRSGDDLVDDADLPVSQDYIAAIQPFVKKIRTVSRWLNALSVETDGRGLRSLRRLPFVERLDLVSSFARNEPPALTEQETAFDFSDPFLAQYGLSFTQINQIRVWPLHRAGFSGRGVVVCLLDSGFRKSHEIFRNARLIAEWDFVNGDGDVAQDFSNPNDYSDAHGTGTWSILGGYKPGELIGPAFGADFILAKTETDRFELPIEEDYWVAGIEWAESLGADVVSSSLGYLDWYTFADMDGSTAVTTRAANRAAALGVVVVNAAGNERGTAWNHIIAPADGFDVIACGAVDAEGRIASFSSPGPTYDGRIKPDVCALGVRNWLAANRSDGGPTYSRGSGTSFATPLVAGAAALLLEIHPEWTPMQVREALLGTASRSGNPDNNYGWGIIDATLAADIGLASLEFEEFEIDDDRTGKSLGNGNGRAEPGETIEITVALRNRSRFPAIGLSGKLSSHQFGIIPITATVGFPPLPASEKATSGEPFVVKIPAFFLPRHAIFQLTVEGPSGPCLIDRLRIPISY